MFHLYDLGVNQILEVENLIKSYRKPGLFPQKVEALAGASFSVRPGRLTGFIGANGAGKTTTLRCLLNFTRPDSGVFSFFGSKGLSMEGRKKIGYLPEHPHFYHFLTGLEFLKLYAQLSGVKVSDSEMMRFLSRVKLEHAADRALSGYSKGMLQRVGLAQALVHRPQLLILDEPMSGLDPDGRRLVREILKEVADQGVSLFFSTHLLDDAENLCDDLVLMAHGKVVFNGPLDHALSSPTQKVAVTYTSVDGKELMKASVEKADLQKEIGRLIEQGFCVVEVRQERKSLDQVFSELTIGGLS